MPQSIENVTTKYHEMIADATLEYETKLAAASQYYYSEMNKIYQDVSRHVENLVGSLSTLTNQPGPSAQ